MCDKSTGYNPVLTGETIQIIATSMALIQSLYEAGSLCPFDENSNNGDVITMTTTTTTTTTADINDSNYVSPVDVAAAFWYRKCRILDSAQSPENDGSLY
jgi:hypothetical protein